MCRFWKKQLQIMKNLKTILGIFAISAIILLLWRPAGNRAIGSSSNDASVAASYKIESGKKSFWAVHSHLSRTDPADNEFASREQTLRVAKKLGINFVRTGFIWRDIQPQPNRWQWAKFDSVVQSARQQQVYLLGVLHAPPAWAFPAHEHLNEWSVFVDSVVTRYGDDITDWEIWNEPNIGKFWPKTAPVERYFDLVKRSYQIIKQKRPGANVVLGGMANQPSAFIFWERLAELGVTDYCDAVAYHPYGVVGEELAPILQRIRGIFSTPRSSPKPIWITEYGWGAWRHPLHPALSKVLTQVLQYCFEQELKIKQPPAILVLDDGYTAETEICDLYEPLRQQVETFGWRINLVDIEALLKFLQTTRQPERQNVVMVSTNQLPGELVEPLIDFVQRGGSVVALGGAPFPKYAARLNIVWSRGQGEEEAPKWMNRTLRNFNLPANAPANNFLRDPKAPQAVRYVPLLSANRQGQALGETAALFDYQGETKGALIAFTNSLTIKSTKHSVTYHEQAIAILKTALVYWLEEGRHFFIYEFRDQERNTKDKYYGLVEKDFRLKDAAQALTWLQQQLGDGAVVRSKNYFNDGAIIELENLKSERYLVTWGREAAASFKSNFMNKKPYAPETYNCVDADKLLAGLERGQKGALTNFIVWRATK
jgi:hypothetical protein